jgi:alpha-mannosidase
VSAANVVVTAVKKAEDDGALIVRFYEWDGEAKDISLTMPTVVESASETDLMEKPIHDLSVQGNGVSVGVKPYEIKTLRIRFRENSRSTPSGIH